MRNTSAFRERFKQWKATGELPYSAGLPKYDTGKDDDLIESLIKYEGFLEHTTDIGDGKQTIGSGLTKKKYTSKGTITRAENREAVQSEIIERRNRLANTFPHWNELPDSAKNALIHYDYNYPISEKSSPKMWRYAAARDWENTAKQMDAGVNMKKFSKGLRTRRKYEQDMFLRDLMPTEQEPEEQKMVSLVDDVLPSRPVFVAPPLYNYINTQYPIQQDLPQSIDSWSSGDSPAPKTRSFNIVSDIYNLQRQLGLFGQNVTLNQPQKWIVK